MFPRIPVTLAAVLLLAVACAEPTSLEVSESRVRALIPGQDKTAGYFTVHNTTAAEIVLAGARAPGVRAIEMHTTRQENGVARMRRLTEVVIAPGETVRFEPGGRHLMLFGVAELGESLEIELHVSNDDPLRVQFETVELTR